MKAIRTYVTGLHRVADDLELAYTLLVASIESLAQDFDGHEGSWNDFDETKRKKIDQALADADVATADRVRAALVEIEHLALSRRFRDFAYLREQGRVGACMGLSKSRTDSCDCSFHVWCWTVVDKRARSSSTRHCEVRKLIGDNSIQTVRGELTGRRGSLRHNLVCGGSSRSKP
jgi:hypothetical protein